MNYDEAFEHYATPLRDIQAALAARRVDMEIKQTGGWVMVGYVFLTDQGHEAKHLGISRELPDEDSYLLCSYLDEEDDGTELLTGTLYEVVDAIGREISKSRSDFEL
jgi:hypothetical protein